MPRATKTTDKPLARIPGKVAARIYRGRLVAADHMKYLDLAALAKASKATIEIGSVNAAGLTAPIVAEVRKGMVVKLRPTHCAGCGETKRKGKSAAAREKAAKAALQKVRELGVRTTRLPVPVARLGGGLGIGIFGITITIIIDYEICIIIEFDDGEICFFCTQTGSFCLQPG